MLIISLGNQTSCLGLHLLVCATLVLLKIHLHSIGFILRVNQRVSIHCWPSRTPFRTYGSKLLIRVEPLHGILVSDQILIILIEFNRITSQNYILKYLSDECSTLPDLFNSASVMNFGFDLIKSNFMGSLDCVGSSTNRTS